MDRDATRSPCESVRATSLVDAVGALCPYGPCDLILQELSLTLKTDTECVLVIRKCSKTTSNIDPR